MMEVVLWAFLTGGITGGVGVAIALLSRQRRLREDYEEIIQELEQRLDATEPMPLERRHDALPRSS